MTRDRAVSTLLAAVAVGTAASCAASPSPWGVAAALLCGACAVVVGACLVTIARTD